MRSKMLLSAIFALALLLCAAFSQLCFLPQRAEIARLEGETAKEQEALVAVQNFMNAQKRVPHAAPRWKSACPLAWDRAISSRFWSAKRSMRN